MFDDCLLSDLIDNISHMQSDSPWYLTNMLLYFDKNMSIEELSQKETSNILCHFSDWIQSKIRSH
jgi:hypothetical protein